MEVVLALPEKPWDWHGLSNHPKVNMAVILAHQDKPWDWQKLSDHTNITMKGYFPDMPRC